jgi:hypothetical protein
MLAIENKHTAKILGAFDVETEEDALQELAKEAGYNSFDDIPNHNRDELSIYEITEENADLLNSLDSTIDKLQKGIDDMKSEN